MHLQELELVNFCQHRYFRHTFVAGLTAIIGPNGSGKSNLLGALRFLLTGVNPNPGDKADNIAQLADPSEKSYVSGKFTHGTVTFTLTRFLRPESKTDMQIFAKDSNVPIERIRGDKQANARLAELLHGSFDLIDEMVLVPQEEIFGFLDLLPAKRAASFQRLFRTEAAKSIHDALNKFVLGLVAAPQQGSSVEECRQQLAAAQTAKQGWEQHLLTLRAPAEIQASRDQEIKVIGNYEARQNTAGVIASESQALQAMQSDLAAVNAREAQYAESRKAIVDALRGDTVAVKAAEAALANLATCRQVEAARRTITAGRDKAQGEMAALQLPTRPADYLDRETRAAALHTAQARLSNCEVGLKSTVADAATQAATASEILRAIPALVPPPDYAAIMVRDTQVETAQRHLHEAKEFIRLFGTGSAMACPTCGTPTTNLQTRLQLELESIPGREASLEAAKLSRARSNDYDAYRSACLKRQHDAEQSLAYWRDQLERAQQLEPVRVEFENVKRVFDASAFYDAAVAGHNSRLLQLQQTIADYNQQEANLRLVEVPVDISESQLQATISSHLERTKAAEEYSQLIGREVQAAALLRGRISQLAATIESRQSAILALADVPNDRYQQALIAKETLGAELETRNAADANLTAALQAVTYWSDGMAAAEQFEKARRVQTEVRARLETVRDLFHHSNLSRFVAHRNLERLQIGINWFLEMFQTDFRVQADEGLSFVATFFDHRRQLAERLSGGQKVVLALAFRLAVNVMFAENIGWLALDEPTAFLDEHHIRGFEPVVQQLRAFSTARGLQCVMITHERGLAPLFDAVIPL